MILFTGSGSIAEAYKEQYDCEIISARKITDEELISWILKSKIIIHNSALINSINLQELIESNFILTQRILNLVYEFNPSIRFINISSMSFLKSHDNYLETRDMSNYAFSKFITEQFCLRHPLKDITNIRFSTLFYKNEDKDGISKLIADSEKFKKITLLNEGKAKRDILPLNIAVEYLKKITQITCLEKTINVV
ncbi:MAG: NAD-dependent epimerase/dehydratase family protein, partial [Flavobacteriales bacterium]|nr:NAD-dependent epimerase/dehydratase family protein [Flavobacteriales bacterium]